MDSNEFRHQGHALIDWIADYLDGIEGLPVRSPVAPGWVRGQLPEHPPTEVEPFDEVIADLDRIIVPALTQWQHPSFFAWFPSNTTYSSILGELASAGLGVNGMGWATSPAATELETTVMDWMAELLNLPREWLGNGVIQDSASSATLCSILAARDRAIAQGARLDQLVGYSTAQAHSSIEKGLRVAGIPAERFRVVAHDRAFAMDAASLATLVALDRANGLWPLWVCSAHGSTSSMAFDPTPSIAKVLEGTGVWLHVDGAMSGIAALCPELRWVNDGLALADSYVTNAHKWMGVNFDCALFWVRDREPLLTALSILPAYLRSAMSDPAAIDYRDWQVPLGRRFRSLKLWFVLRCEGVDALQDMIRQHIDWAQELVGWLMGDARFEIVALFPLNMVCVALRAGDDATTAWIERINASGRALVTRTVLDGRAVARLSVGNRLTELRHVEALWDLMRSELR